MFRASSFLAILVSATAIGSATVPAAAGSLQVFGGNSHLAQLPSKAPASTKPVVFQSPHTIPTAPGSSSMSGKVMIPAPGRATVGNAEEPIPASHGGTSMKNAEIPKQNLPPIDICATHPYLQMCKSSGGGGGGGGGGGSGGGSGGGTGGTGGGNGPVVIVVPPVRVPIAVPVGIPAPVPYGAQNRIAAGGGSASAATAQTQPVITPQCMTAADNPPLAAMIDQLLPTAPLSDAARTQVNELRQTIQVLETDGKDAAARDTEEVAMNLLGYQKVWLRCGAGVFMWQKQVTSADAGQQK